MSLRVFTTVAAAGLGVKIGTGVLVFGGVKALIKRDILKALEKDGLNKEILTPFDHKLLDTLARRYAMYGPASKLESKFRQSAGDHDGDNLFKGYWWYNLDGAAAVRKHFQSIQIDVLNCRPEMLKEHGSMLLGVNAGEVVDQNRVKTGRTYKQLMHLAAGM